MSEALVECVPNISEGRDKEKIASLLRVLRDTPGVKLLHFDVGADVNRSVLSFAGSPEAVLQGARRLFAKAVELIDMTKHQGVHPRLGAVDVCPFVPLSAVSFSDCSKLAIELGRYVGETLKVPVYLYGEAARTAERRELSNIRRGEYEGLANKIREANWQPDFGEAKFNARSGAAIIGSRRVLVAYNVKLSSESLEIAKEIASKLRASAGGKESLPFCRAIGWFLAEKRQLEVSMNITDYRKTTLYQAYEKTQKLAQNYGVAVQGSEIIGLCPEEALISAGEYFRARDGQKIDLPKAELLQAAMRNLGLYSVLKEFCAAEQIIEYRLRSLGIEAQCLSYGD